MLCGYLPFDDESKTILYDKILACNYKIPKHVSPLAADLLQKILVRKVSERYTIEQIKAHPWFSLCQPSCYAEGYDPNHTLQGQGSSEWVPVGKTRLYLDKRIAKLTALKMDVNVDSIVKMVGDNEHNKYTMLYYLLKKKSDRGELDVNTTIKLFEEKARATFQSDNEKTKEIKYKAVQPMTFDRANAVLHLKTLKHTDTADPSGAISDRKTTNFNTRESVVKDAADARLKDSLTLGQEPTLIEQSNTLGARSQGLYVGPSNGPWNSLGTSGTTQAGRKYEVPSNRILQKKKSVEPESIPKHKSSKSEGKPLLSSVMQDKNYHRKQNNLFIFADKQANNFQRDSIRPESAVACQSTRADDIQRQFASIKDEMIEFKPKEKKYQTQIIRNVLRNLVRKKNSPARKVKAKSKSKNPDEKLGSPLNLNQPTKKIKPDSQASSKSRKLQKLFTRKNLSLSLENRKVRDWYNKFQDLPLTSTLKQS